MDQDKITKIVTGTESITRTEIWQFSRDIQISKIKPEFLPTAGLAVPSLSCRKTQIALLSTQLWGIKPEEWLAMEQTWVADVRAKNGNSNTDSKDSIHDVVSTEILTRLYSVVHLWFLIGKESPIYEQLYSEVSIMDHALRGLNNYIDTALSKGYARACQVTRTDGKQVSIYGFLADQGIPMAAAGHYLPNPEVSFPFLMGLLNRNAMRPEIYK